MSVGNRTQAETAISRGYTLDDVLRPENLALAWKQVKANRGSAGIDGMEVENFPAFMREHWEKIRGKLESGTYKPSPVRSVSIPKDGGGRRSLGIPTVLDRLIQQAVAQVLTPLYDPTFSEHAHGFRPMRSAHGAIQEMVREGLGKGKGCHVVDCDLAKFFDTVDHQKLLSRLRERTTDPELLAVILKYLKAGAISREGRFEESLRGVPQGGPLSPLLANILLDELDKQLEERGHKFVRYADDFVILCGSPWAGARILRSNRGYLADKLKLIVNETKSRVVPLAGVRSRVRMYYWEQWGRPKTRRRKLLRLGIGREEVKKASRSRKGHLRMSHNSLVKRAKYNAWLEEQGVPSLEKQWVSIRYPDGPKKKTG